MVVERPTIARTKTVQFNWRHPPVLVLLQLHVLQDLDNLLQSRVIYRRAKYQLSLRFIATFCSFLLLLLHCPFVRVNK